MTDPSKSPWGHSTPPSLFDSLQANAERHPHHRSSPPKQHFIGLFDATPLPPSHISPESTAPPSFLRYDLSTHRLPPAVPSTAPTASNAELHHPDSSSLSDIFPELQGVSAEIHITDDSNDAEITSYRYSTPLNFWQSIFLPPTGEFEELERDLEKFAPFSHTHGAPPEYPSTLPPEVRTKTHSVLLQTTSIIEEYTSAAYTYPTTLLAQEFGVKLEPYQLYLLCALLIGLPRYSLDEFLTEIFPGPIIQIMHPHHMARSLRPKSINILLQHYLPILKEGPTAYINSLTARPLLNRLSKFFRAFLPEDYGTIDDMVMTLQTNLAARSVFTNLASLCRQLFRISWHNTKRAAIATWNLANAVSQHILDNVDALFDLIYPFESSLINNFHQINPLNALSMTDYTQNALRYFVHNVLFKPQYWLFPTLFLWYPLSFRPLLTPNIFSSPLLPSALPYCLTFPVFWFANASIITIPLYLYKRLWLGLGHSTPYTMSDFLQRVFATFFGSLKAIYSTFSTLITTSQQLLYFIPVLIYHYALRVLRMSSMIAELHTLETLLSNYNQVLNFQKMLKQAYLKHYAMRQDAIIAQNYHAHQRRLDVQNQREDETTNNQNLNNCSNSSLPTPSSTHPTKIIVPMQQWQAALYLGQYKPEFMIQTLPLSHHTSMLHTITNQLSSYQYYYSQLHKQGGSHLGAHSTSQTTHSPISPLSDTIQTPHSTIQPSVDVYINDVDKYMKEQLVLRDLYYQQQHIDQNYVQAKESLLKSHLLALSTIPSTSPETLTTIEQQGAEKSDLETRYAEEKSKLGPKIVKLHRNIYDDIRHRQYLEDHGVFMLKVPTSRVFLLATIPPPSQLPLSTLPQLTPTVSRTPQPTTPATPSETRSTSPSLPPLPQPTVPVFDPFSSYPTQICSIPEVDNESESPTPSEHETSQRHQQLAQTDSIPPTPRTPVLPTSHPSTTPQQTPTTPRVHQFISTPTTPHTTALTPSHLTTPYLTPTPSISTRQQPCTNQYTRRINSTQYSDDDIFIEIALSPDGSTTTLIQFTKAYLQQKEKIQQNLYYQQQAQEHHSLSQLNQSIKRAKKAIETVSPSIEMTLAHVHHTVSSNFNGFVANFKRRSKNVLDALSTSLFFPVDNAQHGRARQSPQLRRNDGSGTTLTTRQDSNSAKTSKFPTFGSIRSTPDASGKSGSAPATATPLTTITPQSVIESKSEQRDRLEQQQFYLDLALHLQNTPYAISTFPQLQSSTTNSHTQPTLPHQDLQSLLKTLSLASASSDLTQCEQQQQQQQQQLPPTTQSFLNTTASDILSFLQDAQDLNDSATTSVLSTLFTNIPSAMLISSQSILTNTISGISDFSYGTMKLAIKTTIAIVTNLPIAVWSLLKSIFSLSKFILSTILSLLSTIIKTVLKGVYYSIKAPLVWLYNALIIAPTNYIKELYHAVVHHVSLSRFIYHILPPLPKYIKYPIKLILAPLAAALILLDKSFSVSLSSLVIPFAVIYWVAKQLIHFAIRHIKVFDSLLYNYVWKYIETAHSSIVYHFPFIGILLPLPDLIGHYVHLRYEFDKFVAKFGPNHYLIPLYNIAYAVLIKLPLHVTKYFISQIYHLFHLRDFLIYLATYDFLSPAIHAILQVVDFFNQFFYTLVFETQTIQTAEGPVTTRSSPILRTITSLVKNLIVLPATLVFKPTYAMISTIWSFFFNFKTALQTLQFAESIHDNYVPNFYLYNPISQEYEFAVGDNLAKRLNAMKISMQEKTYDTLTSLPYLTDSPESAAFIRHPMAWDKDTTKDIQRVKVLSFSDNDKFSAVQSIDFISSTMYALAGLPSFEAYLRTFLPYLTHYSPVVTFLKIASNHQELSTYNMWRAAVKDLKQYWDRNKQVQRYSPLELRNIIEEQQINGVFYGTRGIPGQNGFLHPLLQAEQDTNTSTATPGSRQNGGRSLKLPENMSFAELLGLGKKNQQHKIPTKHHEPHEFYTKYIAMVGGKLVSNINQRRRDAYDEMFLEHKKMERVDTSLKTLLKSPEVAEFKEIPAQTPYLQPPMSFYTTTLITCSSCGVTRGINSTHQTSLTLQPFICSEFLPLQGLIEHAMRPKTISNQQYCDVCDLVQRIEFGHRLITALKKQIIKRYEDAYNVQYPEKAGIQHQYALSQRAIQFQNYTYGKWEQLNMYMDDNVYNVIYSNRYSFQFESYPQTLLRVQYEMINLQYQLLLCFHPQLALFYQQQQSMYIHQMNSRYIQQNSAKVQLPQVTFDWILQRTYLTAQDRQQYILKQQQQLQQAKQTQRQHQHQLTSTSSSKSTSRRRSTKRSARSTQTGGQDDPQSQAVALGAELELHKYFNTDYFDKKAGSAQSAQSSDELAKNNVDFVYITITIGPSGIPTTKIRFVQDTLTQFLSSIPPFSQPKSSEEVLINMNSKHTSLLSSLVKIITPHIPYFDFYIKRIPSTLDPVIKPIPNKTSNYEQQTFVTTLPQILPVQFQIFNKATNAKLNTKIAFPQFYNASLLPPALIKRSQGKPTGLNGVNMQYYFSLQPSAVSTSTSNGLVFQDYLAEAENNTKHPEQEVLDQRDRKFQDKKNKYLSRFDVDADYDSSPIIQKDVDNDESVASGNENKNVLEQFEEDIVDPVFLLPHNPFKQGLDIDPHQERAFYSTNPLYSSLNSTTEEYDEYLMKKEHLKFQRKEFYTRQPVLHEGCSDEDTYLYAVMAIIVHFGDSLEDPNGRFATYRRVLPTFHLDGLGRRRCINFSNGYMNPILTSNSIFSEAPETNAAASTALLARKPEHIVDLSYESKSKSRFDKQFGPNGSHQSEGTFMQLPTMLRMSTTSPFSLSTATTPSSITHPNAEELNTFNDNINFAQSLKSTKNSQTPQTPFEATQYAFGLRESFLFDHLSGKKRSVKERFDVIQQFLKQHTQWVLCTSTSVTPTSEYTAMNCLPYMIFYERI